jgi:hypothetical protein
MKQCKQCEQTKSISEFHKTATMYYSSYCKQCHSKRATKYKQNKRLNKK